MKSSTVVIFMGFILIVSIMFLWSRSPQYAHAYPPGVGIVSNANNGWIYVDTATIDERSLSKFAAGWDVDLPMACRLIGERLEGYDTYNITVLPMKVQPTDAARDGKVILQGMLTKGKAVKGRGGEGMIGNYFERTVNLEVID